MTYIDQLSNYHLDVLKEIGNIGSGNATTSLSKLLNRRVEMKVPSVRLLDFNEMMDIVGGAEEIVVSIFLRLSGDFPGNMFFVLSPTQAESFVHKITGDVQFSFDDLDEIGLSAIQELGNILAGSYLSALSDFTKLAIHPSVPSLTMDMAGAVLTQGLIELSQESDYAIIIDTIIKDHDSNHDSTNGHFFLLPDPGAFSKLFDALGVSE
ncbi:chemotaxis protein CheC [Aquibacillus sediminis]|uniref:chemotaxis protein CheC n=1 Tax=Aquibacillus sediminis TaxID=2574734 RepID=UPI001108A885|nr:chemotaxis protein CheC [Aquibacillus sediminis]